MDERKRAANLARHGIDFTAIVRFDWETANFEEDKRRDYGEVRVIGVGRIGLRIHVAVFTQRGQSIRLISLRKANERETRHYEESQGQI